MKYINTNKLETLKLSRENTYIVLDFDKTITANNSDDSWEIAGKLLGKKFKKEVDALWKKYRPIELDFDMPFEEKKKVMKEWHKECMELFHKYNLTKEQITESIQTGNMLIRDGARRFFKKAYDENIPVIILSAGIGNVIEEFLKQQGCYYSNINIISNFIEFDEYGFAKEFDVNSMIHSLNKSMDGQRSIEEIKHRKYKILIGDLIEDLTMLDREELDTSLKIAMIDEYTTDNLIKMYNKAFDIVLTEEDASFEEIRKIFE